MLKPKTIIRLSLFCAAISWVVLVFSDITVLFSDLKAIPSDVPVWLPRIMLAMYVLALFYYYRFQIERDESLNFSDLLWKVFANGLIVTVISLAVRFVLFLIGGTKLSSHILFVDLVYQINLALFINFLLAAYTCWKRLILYQKSKWLIRIWLIFELLLLSILLFDTLHIVLSEVISTIAIVITGLLGIILSVNMRWVAYLNFKQKWISLFLLFISGFYVLYFLYSVTVLSNQIAQQSEAFIDFQNHYFNRALLAFVFIYIFFSFLVVLFNLPTSSVFEQKLEEVINFQRISQSIQTEQSEESVYNILLESSVSSVFADAAWLEIKGATNKHCLFTYHISEEETKEIQQHLQKMKIKGAFDHGADKTHNLSKHLRSLKSTRFRSLVAFPIKIKNETIGTLALLKELPEGFNKEMMSIVSAFANQAGISIENFRLMEDAFQNARYKEELKIAKTVQQSLLPTRLEQDADFEISAFSDSADEVGGDYYDTLRISDHEVALIIADVSGKGTTAAFHMSQMKGIFHSLAQLGDNPRDFMTKANKALAYCLERGSFISATYFVINTKSKKVFYSRAGHCPVLLYQSATQKATYLKDKGTALGMVRRQDFQSFVEDNEFSYQSGDVMVLYTDGITEAKNNKGEEFGYERLAEALQINAHKSPKEIEENVITTLYQFSGSEDINDDYTSMTVKFR